MTKTAITGLLAVVLLGSALYVASSLKSSVQKSIDKRNCNIEKALTETEINCR